MHSKRPAGFTLIETILYTSLVMIFVGTFITSTISIITANERDRETYALYVNEQFINQKLSSLLLGVSSSAITPATGAAATLRIAGNEPVLIDLAGSVMRYTRDSDGDNDADALDTHYSLTNSHALASDLLFTRLTINNQPAIRIQATLTGKYRVTQFDKTVYLK